MCGANACWVEGTLEDANVEVDLGGGWSCFRADDHFKSQHSNPKRMGYCDGIAVRSQGNSQAARLLELKRSVDIGKAKQQLRKGAELLLCELQLDGISLSAEHHVPAGPKNTLRPVKPMTVCSRKVTFTIYIRD